MVKKPDQTKSSDRTQLEKFKEAARAAGTDDSEQAFDRTLKKVAKKPQHAGKGERAKP